jgi:SCY1-like protein 1
MQSSINVAVVSQPAISPAASNNTLRPGASPLQTSSPSILSISPPSTFYHTEPAIGVSTSRSKGMQLGTNKIPAGVTTTSLAAQLAEEAAAEDGTDGNPWGNDDLIDINADQDDWSKWHFPPSNYLAN